MPRVLGQTIGQIATLLGWDGADFRPVLVDEDGALVVSSGGGAVVLGSAERTSNVVVTATDWTAITGLSVSVVLGATSTVVVFGALYAWGSQAGTSYYVSAFHSDGHETTQLGPEMAVNNITGVTNQVVQLSPIGYQAGVAAGTHTFLLEHKVSAGTWTMGKGRIVVVAFA